MARNVVVNCRIYPSVVELYLIEVVKNDPSRQYNVEKLRYIAIVLFV